MNKKNMNNKNMNNENKVNYPIKQLELGLESGLELPIDIFKQIIDSVSRCSYIIDLTGKSSEERNILLGEIEQDFISILTNISLNIPTFKVELWKFYAKYILVNKSLWNKDEDAIKHLNEIIGKNIPIFQRKETITSFLKVLMSELETN